MYSVNAYAISIKRVHDSIAKIFIQISIELQLDILQRVAL